MSFFRRRSGKFFTLRYDVSMLNERADNLHGPTQIIRDAGLPHTILLHEWWMMQVATTLPGCDRHIYKKVHARYPCNFQGLNLYVPDLGLWCISLTPPPLTYIKKNAPATPPRSRYVRSVSTAGTVTHPRCPVQPFLRPHSYTEN